MTRMQVRLASALGLAVATALTVWACGGGDSSSPTGPSGGTGGTSQPTVTLTANGVDPKEINIRSGQTVRFVNNDSRTHEMLTTPHLLHTDCPAINAVGSLAAGASKMTDALNVVRICGYHDHMNPDDQRFRGQINVDTSEGPAPGYIRP
jgi:plastocyanin